MTRLIISIIAALLPERIRIFLLRRLFNYNIPPGCRIGRSIILVDRVDLGRNTRIGHLNIIKGIALLRLDDFSSIGNLNWITGFPAGNQSHFSYKLDRNPYLVVGEHSAITNRHLIDCTDLVAIGRFTTVAGFRSQILTHSISLERNRQECQPISIGDYCFLGTGSILLPNSKLPDYSVLSAGSVLLHSYEEGGVLYGGIPALPIKKLSEELGYFSRVTGFVY